MGRLLSSRLLELACCAGMACSTTGLEGVDGGLEVGDGSTGTAEAATASTSGSDADQGHGAGDDGSGGGEDSSTGDSSSETSGPGEMVAGVHSACPASLPPGWLFCEDFEDLTDPASRFFDYQDGDGAFVPTYGSAASGYGAMAATYRPGIEGSGWLSVAFGRSPISYENPLVVQPDQDFSEIYWRVRVKVEAPWPGIGPGQLSEVSAFATADWSQALVARVSADPDDVVLQGLSASCIVGDELACHGFQDIRALPALAQLQGTTPLFDSDQGGVWHCVEGHVALNTPAVADGSFELWVDDRLQGGSYELDWRGGWTDYGLNLLTIRNLWPGSAPEVLRRDIDDLVLATARIGCQSPRLSP